MLALQNGLDLVNRELSSSNTKLTLLDNSYFDAASVIKCVFGLLQSKTRNGEIIQESESRLDAVQRECSLLESSNVRYRQRERILERDLEVLKVKITQMEQTSQELHTKNQLLSDEIARLKSTNATEKSKYTHDLRRKEKVTDKLKDKLQKNVNDRNGHQKIRICVGNERVVCGVATGLPKKQRAVLSKQDILYNDLVLKLEEREKDLLLEMQMLKSTVLLVYKKLRLAQFQDSDAELTKFILPFSQIQGCVEVDMICAIETLDSRSPLNHEPISAPAPEPQHPDSSAAQDLETLRRQVSELQCILSQQTRLLEMSMDADYIIPPPPDNKSSDRGTHAQDIEYTMLQLEEAHQRNTQRATDLDAERRSFTEAAVRLGFERAALQNERQSMIHGTAVADNYNLTAQPTTTKQAIQQQQKQTQQAQQTPRNSATPKSVSFTPSVEFIDATDFSGTSCIRASRCYSEMPTFGAGTTPRSIAAWDNSDCCDGDGDVEGSGGVADGKRQPDTPTTDNQTPDESATASYTHLPSYHTMSMTTPSSSSLTPTPLSDIINRGSAAAAGKTPSRTPAKRGSGLSALDSVGGGERRVRIIEARILEMQRTPVRGMGGSGRRSVADRALGKEN